VSQIPGDGGVAAPTDGSLLRGIDLLVQDINCIDDAGDDGVDRQRFHAGCLAAELPWQNNTSSSRPAPRVSTATMVLVPGRNCPDWLRRPAAAGEAAICGPSSPRPSWWRRPGR